MFRIIISFPFIFNLGAADDQPRHPFALFLAAYLIIHIQINADVVVAVVIIY